MMRCFGVRLRRSCRVRRLMAPALGVETFSHRPHISLRLGVWRNTFVLINSRFASVIGRDRLRVIAVIVIEQELQILYATLNILFRIERVAHAETASRGGRRRRGARGAGGRGGRGGGGAGRRGRGAGGRRGRAGRAGN